MDICSHKLNVQTTHTCNSICLQHSQYKEVTSCEQLIGLESSIMNSIILVEKGHIYKNKYNKYLNLNLNIFKIIWQLDKWLIYANDRKYVYCLKCCYFSSLGAHIRCPKIFFILPEIRFYFFVWGLQPPPPTLIYRQH